ncbi:uncharacterized protein LOC121390446 [Gigantopelta aegis]|uniref:uncharacterized protein LOC121390446 n=1 Tax=Gigantopelta aegis TaxID=1735272 RepID=UPI001B8873B4|nr:uncharacterized protein LOC121390446 [Gigantopelta aegis]
MFRNNASVSVHHSRILLSLAPVSFNVSKSGNPILPLPDWTRAKQEWGFGWQVHVYGFAALFSLVSLSCALIFCRFFKRILRSKLVLNTAGLLCFAGLFRAFFLLLDPYGFRNRLSEVLVGVLSQVVYPLLCASFGVIQIMLLKLTKLDVGKSRLTNSTCILASTLSYLFCIVIAEVIVFYEPKAKLLLVIDSGFFIVLSLYLCISFICNGFRLSQYACETKRVRKELDTFNTARKSVANINNSVSSNSLRLSRPKLKVADETQMTITIATDLDSSSSNNDDRERPIKTTRRQVRKLPKPARTNREGSETDRSDSEVLLSEDSAVPWKTIESREILDPLQVLEPLVKSSTFPLLEDNRLHTDEDEQTMQLFLLDNNPTTNENAPDVTTETGAKTVVLENGYMADTEVVFYSPKAKTRSHRRVFDYRPMAEDAEESTDLERNSSMLSVNFRTKPTSISLLRIRQSKMIQRTVQMTYFITFLYLFACLLQLYTVFGVYGVFNTSYKPDPWPWYTFQSLYRFTEFSIAMTSTAVVYIILHHRATRGRRKPHIPRAHVSDCVV